MADRTQIHEMLQKHGFIIASLLRRITAYLLDIVVTFVLGYFAWISTGLARLVLGGSGGETPAKMSLLFWAWIVFPLYYGFGIILFGRTVGCYIAGIKIITTRGKEPGLLRAVLRGWIMGNAFAILFPFLILLHSIYILIEWKLRKDNVNLTGWDAASQTLVIAAKRTEWRNNGNRGSSIPSAT